MIPLAHPLIDIFLLGYVVACSVVAAIFFVRFWKETRDFLFLGFALYFLVRGGSDAFIASLAHPNWGALWLFALRPISVLLILGLILQKNFSKD